jgi:hypothetical protein
MRFAMKVEARNLFCECPAENSAVRMIVERRCTSTNHQLLEALRPKQGEDGLLACSPLAGELTSKDESFDHEL